ncbi:MarR family winged helix-turn-helix transcriptional regulator [Aureimonas leprariae]|uniref:MarR family transcriptional regulator n=1 Tax=Plantimonas leprariae TaxID=2615207 RepID=A0A7V7TVN9_9HYPH|nr:MarR family transcriptional regulator [Aureimonas leprariae]KAB0677992.1 MarR family transcriptional regulator [Aureimonas leprariae]
MAGGKKKRSALTHLVLAARAGRTALSVRLAGLDLYPGQDAVLLALDRQDGLSLRDLALRLTVRPPTVTKTVARLSAQGFVEKRASDTDARQSHAFLTESGRALVREVKAAQKGVEQLALEGFSNAERKALRKLLQRAERNLAAAATGLPAEKDEEE